VAISAVASHLQYTAIGLAYSSHRAAAIALFTLYSPSPVATFSFTSGSCS
jgi:hypothetical protein